MAASELGGQYDTAGGLPGKPADDVRSNGRSHMQLGGAAHLKRVAIAGFGTVGQSVAKILTSRNRSALELVQVINRNVGRKRQKWEESRGADASDFVWSDDFAAALSDDVDVVVELMGGLNPAREFVTQALVSGKSVVTANKQLIAAHGLELEEVARVSGAQLLFGAAVCGGMPVLPAMISGLRGDDITEVRGILNGTCNYILTRIEDAGISFEDAVREAQKLGYAEADPTDDVDGYDARAKLAILARVALGRAVEAQDIPCRGIAPVLPLDFKYASRIGCTIRQISWARRENGHVSAWVGPALVPLTSAPARLKGSQNVVVTKGEFGGENVFSGFGAGGGPTAVAVVSDLVSIAEGGVPRESNRVQRAPIAADFECARYVRIVINDCPGVLAALAGAFSRHGINIDAVLQEPGFEKKWLPFVMTLDACGDRQLAAALEEISALENVVERPLGLPVLNG